MFWTRFRHNITFGGDFRRQQFNYLAQQDPRGTFTFTGAATEGTANGAAIGGYDFADFLLGIPDTSSIAFGNADKYFRESVYDAYFTDDWRISPEFTMNAGMRWDYGAPMTELYGRLVNLDITPGFAAVAPVLANRSGGAADRPELSGFADPAGQDADSSRAWGLPGGRSPDRRWWFAPDMESTTTLRSIKPSRSKWRSKRRFRKV